jgi:hypothetical protein
MSATDLFAVMVEACAAHRDFEAYAELLERTAVNLCFALDDAETLSQLEIVFMNFTLRDSHLMPVLARARAIARVKGDRQRSLH